MFGKILNYLNGYVTITLPDECLEKFVNMATARGIYLWGITNLIGNRVALNVRLMDVFLLRHIARMTHCRFHIISRSGWPFLITRLRRRKALLGGALLFVIVLYTLSSYVWFIDIKGNKSISDSQLTGVLQQVGVHRGMTKRSVDAAELEKFLIQRLSGLAWVGVTVDGTRLNVEIVEKVLPPDNGAQIMDLVAQKDGLIKEVLVLSGHPLVQEGDTVTAGQVLISAVIPPPEVAEDEQGNSDAVEEDESQQQVQFVHARGIVRARVWYDGYEEVKLREQQKRPTGQQITKLCMKIGSKEIILMGPRQVPYANYIEHAEMKSLPSWRNIDVPVEFIRVKYVEQSMYEHEFSPAEARRLAGEEALEKLRIQMPERVKILNTDLREVKTANEEDIVRVRVTVETLEEIGVEKPHRADGGGYNIVEGKDADAINGN